MITAGDEFPIHQAPLPIAWPTTSDRNFYDRSYMCAHDRSGDIFVVIGLGLALIAAAWVLEVLR